MRPISGRVRHRSPSRPIAPGLLVAALLLSAGPWATSASAQDFTLRMHDVTVRPGETFSLSMLGTWGDDVQGYSLAVVYPSDPPIVDLDVSFDDTLTGAYLPEFALVNVYESLGQLQVGILLEFSPPFDGESLPPLPFPLSVGDIVGRIPDGTPPQEIPFDFQNGIGSPPLDNVYVVWNESVQPQLMGGGRVLVLEPLPPPPPAPIFLRGDANQDGNVDIGDALFHINYTFGSGPVPGCLDAGDANDDGHSDISDAVTLLMYLFVAADPLPAPFPTPGVDPTHDALGCASYDD